MAHDMMSLFPQATCKSRPIARTRITNVRQTMSPFRSFTFVCTLAMLALANALTAADAALVNGELWPDDNGTHINAHGGGILSHEGTYYWFGEHKIGGVAGNDAHVGVHVYASKDLTHWNDRGIALAVSKDPKQELADGCRIERPKVIYNAKTATFVMWFHLDNKKYSLARAALAISKTPTGPYTYVSSQRPNAGVWPIEATDELKNPPESTLSLKGRAAVVAGSLMRRDLPKGQMSRDMTLFVDDDAKAYLIAAAEDNQTLQLHELTADYQGFSGKWTRILPGDYNEGPTVFKHQGAYFMITSACTGWIPNPARSATATSIWGPWKKLGNPCRGTAQEVGTTFESQSTFVLPLADGGLLFMADRWRPKDAIDGRYVWLPIAWEGDQPILRWQAHR